MEVTEEQHWRSVAATSSPPSSTKKRRLRFNLRRRRRKGLGRHNLVNDNASLQNCDVMSTGDLSRAIAGINLQSSSTPAERDTDAVTISGIRSVSTFQTFSSHDTIKASNKADFAAASNTPRNSQSHPLGSVADEVPPQLQRPRRKHWKKALEAVKRIPGSNNFADGEENGMAPVPLQHRTLSSSSTAASTTHSELEDVNHTYAASQSDLWHSDELKQLDGMDVLSLGSAFTRIFPIPDDELGRESRVTKPWAKWHESSTDMSQQYDTATSTHQMLLGASGHHSPAIVLEGFCEEDRWILAIDQQDLDHAMLPTCDTPTVRHNFQALHNSSSEEDGSPQIPASMLWSKLWGSGPIPASIIPASDQFTEENDPDTGEDFVLETAAGQNVPIDIDEDTFIVSTPEHLRAIHAIVSVPIASGKFGAAVRVLKRLLRGLDSAALPNDCVKDNIKGCTCHNIGLLCLWQANYDEACQYFRAASKARTNCPLVSKRDKAVTMVRYGQALFAARNFSESLKVFEQALVWTCVDQVIHAKILVNAGVSSYHLGDIQNALHLFTQALSLQRKWLEDPIRRESLVYDASTTLCNMGKLYLERGDNAMARLVYKEALVLQKTAFSREHPLIIESLQNLAFVGARQSEYTKAIKLLDKCRRLQGRFCSTNNATPWIETCGRMAHLCALVGQTVQAQTLYETVHSWQKAVLPSHHPARHRLEQCMKEIHSQLPATAAPWL